MDGRTDNELIWGGLGNLRFLQVNIVGSHWFVWESLPRQFYLEDPRAAGHIPSPPQINLSVSLSVRHITFNYSAENLLIPTIKATIETSWY